ncbi:YdcF family protein [Fodinicurvata sediminis]|uniref:YdcF family protein n=1 Tax=Fodinicurvata sediminis TaxID=1121832 RepID=UPI0003B67480|nr:ElyC/SanA/YdcF family protein [Fodinicurvata sediminis]
MFFLKKLLGALLSPVGLVLVLLLAGVVLMLVGGAPRLARGLLACSLLLFLAFSLPWLPNALLRPLESQVAPLAGFQEAPPRPRPKAIVVLGAGHHVRPGQPPADWLGRAASARLMEALRLRGLAGLSDLPLIFTGDTGRESLPVAEAMKRAALSLGVPEATIVSETAPRDTAEEMTVLSRRLGKSPFVLVTSAAHMPRALRLAEGAGLNPIPAPTDYRLVQASAASWQAWLPSAGNLQRADHALHEWLGLLWLRIKA